MRDFHRKDCEVTRGVYYQVKGVMMDYERLKKEREDILYGAQYCISGMPGGGAVSAPTEQKAVRLVAINRQLEAIDQTAVLMRSERGHAVGEDFDTIKAYWSYDYFNCQHKRTQNNPNGPCRRTWNNFKDRFSAAVAQRLEIF